MSIYSAKLWESYTHELLCSIRPTNVLFIACQQLIVRGRFWFI